jgi:hypothetical protein
MISIISTWFDLLSPNKSWKNFFQIVHKGYQKKHVFLHWFLKKSITLVLNDGKKI